MQHLVEVKPRVGQFACIKLGTYCTAQGKVSYVGNNGQVTIHIGGEDTVTGTVIPSFRRLN